MGFNEIKYQVIHCLKNGNILYAERKDINVKNLLAIGEITTQDLIGILKKSKGNEHQSSPHHYDPNINVHIIKTSYSGVTWYIKWYFDEPNSIFISVHS